jgi:hypothetical protein
MDSAALFPLYSSPALGAARALVDEGEVWGGWGGRLWGWVVWVGARQDKEEQLTSKSVPCSMIKQQSKGGGGVLEASVLE